MLKQKGQYPHRSKSEGPRDLKELSRHPEGANDFGELLYMLARLRHELDDGENKLC